MQNNEHILLYQLNFRFLILKMKKHLIVFLKDRHLFKKDGGLFFVNRGPLFRWQKRQKKITASPMKIDFYISNNMVNASVLLKLCAKKDAPSLPFAT